MTTQPALPTPRALLTTLIKSLPPTPEALTAQTNASNPLKSLSPSSRNLLATLHVLLPDILLKSLDLLDRGLVTRIVPHGSEPAQAQFTGNGDGNAEPTSTAKDIEAETETSCLTGQPQRVESESASAANANAGTTVDTDTDPNPNQDPKEATSTTQDTSELPPLPLSFYLVKSSQESRPSRFRASDSTTNTSHVVGRSYIVRTTAWSCSCEAFAFSAFPASSSYSYSASSSSLSASKSVVTGAGVRSWRTASGRRARGSNGGGGNGVNVGRDGGEHAWDANWEFGGLSRDGCDGDAVPCCKHLLACVLAERWAGSLGAYVKVREVGREEMAGIIADG